MGFLLLADKSVLTGPSGGSGVGRLLSLCVLRSSFPLKNEGKIGEIVGYFFREPFQNAIIFCVCEGKKVLSGCNGLGRITLFLINTLLFFFFFFSICK